MSKTKCCAYVLSKWAKTKVILPNEALAAHIPETRRMTRQGLEMMLDQYRMVYVKPDKGTYGTGVMRVEREDGVLGTIYRFQEGKKERSFYSYDEMYRAIKKRTGRRMYLVQKGIHLLKHKKRRFDLRVMVQMSPSKKWVTTGIIGRLADPKKVVTNVHNGER
ncbi:YheC/YheD family protein [Paenibacillus sp. P25]|nr:YheC/YheD family protein [Paenibacillus sp. P25]